MTNSINAKSILFLIMSFLLSFPSVAQETKLMVRVKSKDAKFIGTSIGGAKIYIRDAFSQDLLAEGITSGSTGNTEVIMKQAHQRRKNLSDSNTAGFLAKLDLEKPTFITVEAVAPHNAAHAQVKSSTQLWVIPGKDIVGDGIVLEIPGFIVDILSPQRHETLDSSLVELKANIIMMCGCPISPGGMWDANDYEVKAIISKEGKKLEEITLKYTGKTNTFSGNFKGSSGFYEAVIYAYDSVTGNTGVDKTNFILP